MLAHPFMRDAILAGTGIGAACGAVGYFLVLRGQVFSGDALSHVAFTGAVAALAAGLDLRLGLFGAIIGVAVAMGFLGRAGRADDVVIGSVFAWILGLGVLFLSIYTSSASGTNGTAGVGVLFGSILALTPGSAMLATAVGILAVGAVVVLARPLLFGTVAEEVASGAGVPVRMLGIAFLVVVGVTAAEATQAVGALLLLGLLAAPAATAQLLTTRPFAAFWLAVALAVAWVWAGLVLSYLIPKVPPSFAIVTVASVAYAAALASTRSAGRSTTNADGRASEGS
jgi:zinc/manganese transport system permease protein